ncbi:MAG: hypothetical protein IPJ52_09405 [Rhodocyclaceae bacterium]|nr:hypothetical protein [Rhodocyclaceae bacterium]
MAKLKDAGDLDIRSIVTGAARKIVNAARSGVSMSKFLAQGDLLDGSAERRVAEMFARNARSAKRIAERLVYWADFAYAESRRGGIDIFGEKIPTASREDIIKGLTDDTAGQEDLGQQGRWRPGNGNDGREANDRGRPQDAGVAQANQQHRQYRSAQELLSSYSAADLSERQARIEAAEKEQAKLQAELAKQEGPA